MASMSISGGVASGGHGSRSAAWQQVTENIAPVELDIGGRMPAEIWDCPDWQLESTVIETVLGAFLVLPESSKKSIYYISLITEICKLSPSTVGPAVGKSIRRLYSSLADGLDVEAARRFAEWFAVHMSNFGFQWVWKEWVPDLELTVQHPKRAFMRRAIEFEIRLAYHERIYKTLPEPMQAPDAYTIPENGPTPAFEYEDPSHPHHDAAQAILNLFRGAPKPKMSSLTSTVSVNH
ncbi:hypothetical protein NMY22_g15244 [Coprinellus aureogranulatus]|nr:hypothetical protein NMY22_g15244 [Coprinellus aureogranulatus]